jgi:hypothetical protein
VFDFGVVSHCTVNCGDFYCSDLALVEEQAKGVIIEMGSMK